MQRIKGGTMERIKGGTMERVASNCYGNWNFANKYFSIACFSNKLINSFCYLALLLSPRPPFFSVHSFPSYLGMNGKVLLFDPSYLSAPAPPPHTNKLKSGNALFVQTLRQEVSLFLYQEFCPFVSVIIPCFWEVW